MRFLVAVLAVLFFPVLVQAQQLERVHHIEIEVECLDTAREIISALNGYNLDSSAYLTGGIRRANFTRRVDYWAFRHVQYALRDLGEVLSESENSWHLGAEISHLNTRVLVLSQEIERLSLMMAASDTLEVLIAVNDRLSAVSRERDGLLGRRNVLYSQAASPVIHIRIFETPEYLPPPEPTRFGERVSRSFLNSLAATGRFFGNALVALVGASAPLVVWTIIGGGIALIVLRVRRNKRKPVQNADAPASPAPKHDLSTTETEVIHDEK